MPNESAKIILAATHSKLTKVRDPLIVEGTVNALKVEFQFRTTDWDSTIKTAVFVRGRATPSTSNADLIHVTLDENNECDVPSEILVPNGHFSVGVFGVGTDHTIPSNWMYYHTADGCYTSGGNTPIDTTPSLYEQILKILQNKSDIGHDHNQTYYTKLESDERYARRGESIGSIVAGVTSINNKTGDVILNAEDVGAFANITRQTETEIYNDVIRNGDIQHDSIGLIEGHQYKLEIHYNPSGTPRVDTIMVTARYSELLQCVAVPNRNDDDYVASGMTDPGNDGFAIGDTVTHVHANWFNQFVPVSVKLYAVNYIQVPTIPYDAIIDPPITQVQPDWNQTDSTAIDYIKNRPFGDEIHATDISGTTYTITGFNSSVLTVTHEPLPLRLGQVWAVRSNNESNDRILSVQESDNGELYLGTLTVNNVPFCIKSTETTVNASYRSQMGVSRFMLTCVSGVITSTYVKQVEQKYVPNADWNQNDESGDGYIKNRTHWKEEKTNDIVLVDNITLDNFEDTESGFYRQTTDCYVDFERTMGQTYFVIWDGVEYECVCGGIVEDFGIGNANIMGDYGSKTAEPFAIHHSSFEDPISVSIKDNGSHTLSILQRSTATEIHYLDSKYIKDMYYDNTTEEVIVDNLTSDEYMDGNYPQCTFVVGDAYHVIWNGTLYENLTCSDFDGWRVLGNPEVCPFYIDDNGGDALYIEPAGEESFIVSIIHVAKDINKIDSKYLPDNVATIEYVDAKSVQSDWLVNDDTDSAYIKNRTHYEENKNVVVVPATEIQNRYSVPLEDVSALKVGNQCVVTIDGVEYETTVRENVNLTIGTGVNTYDIGIGSWMYLNTSPANVGVVQRVDDCPFALVLRDNELMFAYETKNAANDFHTVEVRVQNYELHKLDAKYLPDNLATYEYVDSKAAQSNWHEFNENSASYVNNRPMYFDVEVIMENLTASGNTGTNTAIIPEFIPVDGTCYYIKGAHTNDKKVVTAFDGVYECKNGVIDILTWESSGCPILNISANGINVGISNSTRVASVVIDVIGVATYHTLDERYIPDTIIRVKDVSNIIEDKIKEIGVNITAATARIGNVELLADKWVGTSSPYSQVVTVDGATENSQVDLTPSVEQLAIFHHKDLAFVTENEDGIVTVYAIGQKPENDYVIQVTITEVII